MEQEKKYPVIDYGFDEAGYMGLQAMALVEYPAIEVDFVKFSKDKVQLSSVNKERRMVFGPALIPDQLIYREDGQGEPYYARFRAPVIERTAHEFLKKNLHHNANIEHALPVAGVYVAESWIKWSEDDKSQYMGFDLPIGTWFIGMKVEDDDVWEDVLKRKVKGFSIEGIFKKVTEQMVSMSRNPNTTEQDELIEVENYLRRIEESL